MIKIVKRKRQSLYYFFEDSVKKRQNDDCIWSREGCYTWNQTYARVNQYAQWYLEQGVQPKDLVCFYMMNSPDFVFAWLGLWAVGAAPAMINYSKCGFSFSQFCARLFPFTLVFEICSVSTLFSYFNIRAQLLTITKMKISLVTP